MATLKWNEIGKKIYETGIKKCVLYVKKSDGKYNAGVAWNGLTSVTESPEGGEANDVYADDIKYLTLRSSESFKATVEAYTYPDEFLQCEGIIYPVVGVFLGQQPRKPFSLCYRTTLGNDVHNDSYGYKLHIIYDATATPSEKAYQTIDDSPEAVQFVWEVNSVPILVNGYKPTSVVILDSTKIAESDLTIVEEILYGNDTDDPKLLLPEEIADIISIGLLYDESSDYLIIGEDRICV